MYLFRNWFPATQIGRAYIGYDCCSNTICVATHLEASYLYDDTACTNNPDGSRDCIGYGIDQVTEVDPDICEVIEAPGKSA